MAELNITVDAGQIEELIRRIIREEFERAFAHLVEIKQIDNLKITRPLDMSEACEFLRLSRGTVQKLIKDGVLESTKPGSKRLFTKAAIENYLFAQNFKNSEKL